MKKAITFRFDDICPTMNFENFYRAVNILEKYHVKGLLGIVPDNLDETLMVCKQNDNFWKDMIMLSEKGWVLAMHGYNHVYDSYVRGKVNFKALSEFAGLDYYTQSYRLLKGKEILEERGVKTEIFFAPGHSYDNVTIEALRDVGFKYISDGGAKWGFSHKGVSCIPFRNGGIDAKGNGLHTVALHTNNMNDLTFEKLEKFIQDNHKNIVSFNVIIENFEDYKGNDLLMMIEEKVYVFYQRQIRLKLSPIYQIIKSRFIKGSLL